MKERRMRRFGLVNGCMDLFHEGHKAFLCHAAMFCDILRVAVNDDASVRRLKGEGRPVQKARERAERVAEFANIVTVFDGDVRALIKRSNPDIIIRGWDQEIDFHGIPYVVLPRYLGISTTMLLEEQNGDL